MKTRPLLLLSLLAGLAARAETVPGFTVHEWGTFTTLAGADGYPLAWYQSFAENSPLPEFVHAAPVFTKSMGQDRVRMETPVLYFYPPRAMGVSVKAAFQSGRITEWFPGGKATKEKWVYGASLDHSVAVAGELISPADAAAAATVPSAEGPRGAHYAAARAVPEAWFFRSRPDTGSAPETDRFFFYRGAGQSTPPYRVRSRAGNVFELQPTSVAAGIAASYALSVRDTQASWKRLPALPAWEAGAQATPPPTAMVTLDPPSRPLEQVDRELSSAITSDLVAGGLTADEARAMVATWRGLWFREEGDRVLALLPRAWVDQVLPLTLTPAPEKLERVFVARFELFTPEREAALVALLDSLTTDAPTPASLAALDALSLGRFADGALDLGVSRQANRTRARFHALLAPPAPAQASR